MYYNGSAAFVDSWVVYEDHSPLGLQTIHKPISWCSKLNVQYRNFM
jgi:hypothetical protein